MRFDLKRIASNAIIAALYVSLTLATAGFAYRDVQFRIAEILILLVFFRKDYLFGLAIGCFLANLFGPLGFVDAVFGTLATIVSGLLIAYSKQLFLASLYPAIINGIVIGAELYFLEGLPFWLSALFVAFGELTVIAVFGYMLFSRLRRQPFFLKMIDADQNIPLDI